MLSFIKEKKSCWELIKEDERPVFIYGMGDGAVKILQVFQQYNITVHGFFASDEYVRGHYFSGHLVHKLSEIEALVDDFIIVLGFAAGYQSLVDRVEDLACRHTVYAPDVPLFGEGLFTPQFVEDNADKIDKVYNMLEDELSKKVFADVMNFRISGKIDYLKGITTTREEVYTNIISPSKSEIFVDLGAYNGDTVEEFLNYCDGDYSKIYALEPDKRNFKRLMKANQGRINFEAFNCAVWNCDTLIPFSAKTGRQSSISSEGEEIEARSVDSILLEEVATIIKMDVEGAEREALLGARNTIEKHSPKLMVSLYHRNEDFFEIPLLVKRLNPDYKLYIRHHLYIPAWETNLYCKK